MLSMAAIFMSEFIPLYLVAMLDVAGQIVYDLTKRLLRGCFCMIRGLPNCANLVERASCPLARHWKKNL
jgi:hypothetical protein